MLTPRRLFLSAALAITLLWSGCGAPGDPLPPLLNIPARTTDLEATQRAGDLVLRWTVPAQTTESFPVKDLDRVVVLGMELEGEGIDGSAFESGARELLTLEHPQPGERVERRLPLPAAPGKRMAVAIKNYNRRGRAEGLSNIAVVEIAPALAASQKLAAIAQPGSIRLEWSPVPGARGYRIYRSTGEKGEFAFLAAREAAPFDDADFEWGTLYRYFVRAYVQVSTGIAESSDSPTASVVPKDIFPPSPPGGLRAVASETAVELSWNLSPEPDTAGYHVYRRDASGRTVRLNTGLLAAPVFSDKQIQRQQQYSYMVTAVDDKGNESAQTAPLAVTVP